MKLFSILGWIAFAACGSVSHLVEKQGKEVVIVHAKSDTPFSELTGTRTITHALQLRFGCAYQYEEVIAESVNAEVDSDPEKISFMIDTSGKGCSRRPSSWYVLIGPKDLDEVQLYVDLVARLMAGDYKDETSTPSLMGRRPGTVEISRDGVELSYAIPPFYYLVSVDMAQEPPMILGSKKWQ
ncbi:hypothetical protein [Pseudoxanthomonas sp. z9]|uniref:hypothetical protein n=1 Tax=Pseudoxanthomonas sp. z9 TaxID=2584942 RepID=UPI001142682D|nr:hypothetical protein [Pseudoxanthomonas sp. z9]